MVKFQCSKLFLQKMYHLVLIVLRESVLNFMVTIYPFLNLLKLFDACHISPLGRVVGLICILNVLWDIK